jgi:hypothetical protein
LPQSILPAFVRVLMGYMPPSLPLVKQRRGCTPQKSRVSPRSDPFGTSPLTSFTPLVKKKLTLFPLGNKVFSCGEALGVKTRDEYIGTLSDKSNASYLQFYLLAVGGNEFCCIGGTWRYVTRVSPRPAVERVVARATFELVTPSTTEKAVIALITGQLVVSNAP